MIYLRDGNLIIRNMIASDAKAIANAEIAQGWDAAPAKYEMRLRDQQEGRCTALTAEWMGEPVGYINVYFQPQSGPFAHQGIAEIVDFGVLEKCRRMGIGSRLMDIAESIAQKQADKVYLGVGLHSGYGSAQRLYIKRGYVPDGSGVWYRDEICTPYAPCANDDDLVLYLSKRL